MKHGVSDHAPFCNRWLSVRRQQLAAATLQQVCQATTKTLPKLDLWGSKLQARSGLLPHHPLHSFPTWLRRSSHRIELTLDVGNAVFTRAPSCSSVTMDHAAAAAGDGQVPASPLPKDTGAPWRRHGKKSCCAARTHSSYEFQELSYPLRHPRSVCVRHPRCMDQ